MLVDAVPWVVCVVVDRRPDVHHRARDQVDQELHDSLRHLLQIFAPVVLAVELKGDFDEEYEGEVEDEEECDGESSVVYLENVLSCDKEYDENKNPGNDLSDVTEEQGPHVADVLKQGHPILEVTSHCKTEALEDNAQQELAKYFFQEASLNVASGDEMRDPVESFFGGCGDSPLVDLVVEGHKQVENNDHLQEKVRCLLKIWSSDHLNCSFDSIFNGFNHDPDALEFYQVLPSAGFVSRSLVLDSPDEMENRPDKPNACG